MSTPKKSRLSTLLTKLFFPTEKATEVPSPLPSTTKHILITVHGFGRKQSKEMEYIKQWGEEVGWEVVIFDMFPQEIETAPDFEQWMEVAKNKIEEYMNQNPKNNNQEITLLGFSMGGVIASHLASELAVDRLILLATAFDYLGLDAVTRLFTQSANSFLNDSDQAFIKDLQSRLLPPEYVPQFVELVRKYKHSITNVTCPILLMHGSEDEVISVRSSRQAYRSIKHNQKKLFVIEDGSHQLMLDPFTRKEVFALIRLFLTDEIVKEDSLDLKKDELGQ